MENTQSTSGRLAIVAGGAMGIGGAAVRTFVARGWAVAILDRDAQTAIKLAEELTSNTNPQVAAFGVDITSTTGLSETIAAVRARFPDIPVRAAVNSVGVFDERETLLNTTLESFRRVLDVNLLGAFLFTKAVEPLLAAGASIVHVGSINGTISGAGLGAYKVSKAALHMMARCLARELARDPRRIRVNVAAPSWVDTPGERRMLAAQGKEKQLDDPETGRWIPLGRRPESAEVAAVIAFLCSDDAASITGQIIYADGGVMA